MDIHGLGTGGEAERRTPARAAAYDECVSVVVVAEWRDNKSGFGLRGSVIKHGVYEVVYSHRLSLARARKPGSAPTSLLSFIPEVIRNFFLIYEHCFCGRRNNMSPHYLEKSWRLAEKHHSAQIMLSLDCFYTRNKNDSQTQCLDSENIIECDLFYISIKKRRGDSLASHNNS